MSELSPADKILVTVEEAAALLSLSRTRIYDLIRVREIPVVRSGRAVRLQVADLHTWARQQAEGEQQTWRETVAVARGESAETVRDRSTSAHGTRSGARR